MTPQHYIGYEWSESGLKLLENIKLAIVKNGGEIRTAIVIELEWANNYQFEKLTMQHRRNVNHVPWSREEKDFILNNRYLSAEDISLQMKRSKYAVQRKLSYINKQLKNKNNGSKR